MEKLLWEMSMDEFVGALSSSAPTPGGGAAAAATGALAAALAAKVAALAAQRGANDELDRLRHAAASLIEKLLKLGEDDARAYGAVVCALRLPKSTEAEKEKREESLAVALKWAAQVPMMTAKRAGEVLAVAEELIPHSPRSARSDLVAAAHLAYAAGETALANVHANCLSIRDDDFLSEMAREVQEIFTTAEKHYSRVLNSLMPVLEAWLGERDSNPH